MSNCKSH